MLLYSLMRDCYAMFYLKQDYLKSRMGRSSVFPAASYGQPEDSFYQDVIATVEKSMKKHTDSLMRFLEGISSRLSQLELYCYNLDKSIGEMRSDLVRDHGESQSKLKSLEKHVQEVSYNYGIQYFPSWITFVKLLAIICKMQHCHIYVPWHLTCIKKAH